MKTLFSKVLQPLTPDDAVQRVSYGGTWAKIDDRLYRKFGFEWVGEDGEYPTLEDLGLLHAMDSKHNPRPPRRPIAAADK